jgi:hypothetical protein
MSSGLKSRDAVANDEFASAPLDPEFNPRYRSVPALVPVSLFFGLAAASSLLGVAGVVIAVVGMLLALCALWQVRSSDGEYGGRKIALAGLALSAFFFISGTALQAYNYVTEVPEGFERLSFTWLAKQEPRPVDGLMQIAPEAQAWDGQPVYVKGYMYPTRQTTGITSFTLCKDTGQCCFGGQPKLTDMMIVDFGDRLKVNHREQQLVGVAGVLRVKPVVQAGQVVALYTLEGSYFR